MKKIMDTISAENTQKEKTVGTVDSSDHLLEPKPEDELTHFVRVCYEAPADQIFAVCLSSNYDRRVLQMTPTVLTSHHEAPLKSLQYPIDH